MSKPYRIQVQDSITVSDCSTFQIDAPPLATQEEFADILEEIMEHAGWERNEEGKLTFSLTEEEQCTFYPETMQIKTTLQQQEEVNENLEGWSPKALNEQADRMLAQREKQLAATLAQRLEENKEERKQLLDNLVVEATASALKTAAQRLGSVQDIHEEHKEDGSYLLTITIQEND